MSTGRVEQQLNKIGPVAESRNVRAGSRKEIALETERASHWGWPCAFCSTRYKTVCYTAHIYRQLYTLVAYNKWLTGSSCVYIPGLANRIKLSFVLEGLRTAARKLTAA